MVPGSARSAWCCIPRCRSARAASGKPLSSPPSRGWCGSRNELHCIRRRYAHPSAVELDLADGVVAQAIRDYRCAVLLKSIAQACLLLLDDCERCTNLHTGTGTFALPSSNCCNRRRELMKLIAPRAPTPVTPAPGRPSSYLPTDVVAAQVERLKLFCLVSGGLWLIGLGGWRRGYFRVCSVPLHLDLQSASRLPPC